MKTYRIFIYFVLVLCFSFPSNSAKELTDEVNALLPRLFHLDDYHSCLSQSDGLYCLAKLRLTPTEYPHPTYDLLKEYSADVGHYNRTVVHRGYCVSARCAEWSRVADPAQRLQRCASERLQPLHLRALVHTLHYCRRHNDTLRQHPPDAPQNAFLYIVYATLLLNILGTIYDIFLPDRKNTFFQSWSMRANWNRLTTSYEAKDPRLATLAPVQGCRVTVMLIILYGHAVVLQDMVYAQNPEYMEESFAGKAGVIMLKGASLVQTFVILSSFLCAYNLLLSSDKSPLSMKMFIPHLLKRIARITPVYLLVVGYGATWWPRARDGPLTPLLIGAQSQVCRDKFWYHAFYLNNLFDSQNHCFIQTWFLAMDMQLYILALFLTLALAPLKRKVLPVYAGLFVGSCILVSCVAYLKDWRPLMYIANPESLRNLFQDTPSYQGLYTSPLGSLPACMMGLFAAHLHYYLNDEKQKISDSKIFGIVHHFTIPVYIAWLISGVYIKTFTSRAFTGAYAGIERFIFSVLCTTQLIGSINYDNRFRRFFAWRGFDLIARVSLPVMMIHWCVNMILVVPRPYTIFTSTVDIVVDSIATAVITYILAFPISLMVELPMQKILYNIIEKTPSCK